MAAEEPPNLSSTTILVTGGSGFVASHLILQLLDAGYKVHTTIRDLSQEVEVRTTLSNAFKDANTLTRLSFFEADLMKDEGWTEACKGCTYVHHVASPFPFSTESKDEDELIVPAREGTLRVLKTAKKEGVKRIILTSSFAAIGYGHAPERNKEPFTETDWSDLSNLSFPVPAYHKSKTLAELAAWEFISKECGGGGGMELTVINSVGIFGPVLGKKYSASIELVKRFLDGSIFACPEIYLSVVDVRDLAKLHVLAMLESKAAGERFIAKGGKEGGEAMVSFLDVAKCIRRERGELAGKVPKWQLWNWVVWFLGVFSEEIRGLRPQLGGRKCIDAGKAREVLGWEARGWEETVLDCADSLVVHGVV